jgi:hypothetical protein
VTILYVVDLVADVVNFLVHVGLVLTAVVFWADRLGGRRW